MHLSRFIRFTEDFYFDCNMWIIVWVLVNVIWNTVDTRHINKLSKGKQYSFYNLLLPSDIFNNLSQKSNGCLNFSLSSLIQASNFK